MRRYIRHPSEIPIECRSRSKAESFIEPLHNVSQGGLAFISKIEMEKGHLLELKIDLVDPPFVAEARVVWCKPQQNQWEIGVELLNAEDVYAARMVEQICHIEQYKKQQAHMGRMLDSAQAAKEWIEKYAADFPSAEAIIQP